MDIAKQIIDQRIYKIIADNPELFFHEDIEKKRSKAFLLLGVAAYLDIDIAEAAQFITDGGGDGGFDAAYIAEAPDTQLNVILFQSKYSRNLDKDSNFPANAIEKAVNTVRCVFDPASYILLNPKSKEKVDEIRSFILDGHIPFVTFVMLNNGLPWTQEGDFFINNAFSGQEQVHFVHFCHTDIIQYINRSAPICTQLSLSGRATQENFNYKRVILAMVGCSFSITHYKIAYRSTNSAIRCISSGIRIFWGHSSKQGIWVQRRHCAALCAIPNPSFFNAQ